jgi:NDP-sugar pyrophosphorylase family protein
MKFAIIAAGEGSRLANEGVGIPKPLVRINDEPMIDRLIRIFISNKASSISIIVNEEMNEVYDHVCRLKLSIPLHIVHKSTPSSMHSFYELSHTLGDDRFCLTTVDTVFREDEFARYINAFRDSRTDGLMAVTDYIDDEKPLYVETGEDMAIKGFHDADTSGFKYISGGVYCLGSNSIPVLKKTIEEGMFRLRNYQRRLVDSGLKLKAWPFSKIIDVDHREDIPKAESLVKI